MRLCHSIILFNSLISISICSKADDPALLVASEFKEHFNVEEKQLETVEELLIKMKKLAHSRSFKGREFGHDAVEDSKKEVAISTQQGTINKKVSPFLFEGDIFLSRRQAVDILKALSKDKTKRLRRSFVSDKTATWKTMPIKYRFHESIDFYTISQIIAAIRFWEDSTCITFENVSDSPDGDYIEFFSGQGCYSMIGRNGGRQGISIGESCVKMGVIEHEIGHALGLWHEQSRPDALGYVTIERDFILPSYISDFLQRDDEIDTLGIPYDLGSVMHYGSTAFSVDQKSKTVVTRDSLYQQTIGQREKLSFYDVATINTAYCKDECKSEKTKCENGGYMRPSKCSECLCPDGLGGEKCEKNEDSKNAECGGIIKLTEEWKEIESPNYPDPGYEADQKCSWLLKAEKGKRVEIEFIEDFSFLCTSTCVDFVELKISDDLRNTGFRFCCYDKPEISFVSQTDTAIIIFRSQLSTDIGFKIQAKSTDAEPRTTIAPTIITTTLAPITVDAPNVWADWGEWSMCSRTCGGCGIRSRVRSCRSKKCEGRRQEFGTCNLKACPVDKHCAKLLSNNRLCNGKVCTKNDIAISSCDAPQCCPPFINVDGVCQSDQENQHDELWLSI
ncbi:Zinc metalloproteinase nas-36 [Caenorhabditis elegans]|uniref:Zinc metalloproteinase nas-36 n=1 Tax=Caenorhabditis elegans TaxID=6239 RepID=NAS36_CAEEL|nr:Zinc metalloproteinase nas-36 [Caenorhabditis elegans]Q18206.2 RecName: Full=Zinc metalloproteinase nas-36; AltName: Full=Nematode astacin 36; Flags: Precursor [Caenorhabditis elegans]CAA96596.2 Zinc metalloproteinase nas-36 [Caenorhabditis elegans]|eukprot:NP_492109.2 Zinc metalloproteinase nas-36 [Caenorhabditis elegans]